METLYDGNGLGPIALTNEQAELVIGRVKEEVRPIDPNLVMLTIQLSNGYQALVFEATSESPGATSFDDVPSSAAPLPATAEKLRRILCEVQEY